MDKDAERQRLESDLREVENFSKHPITRRVLDDCKRSQEVLIDILCNREIVNIETFFGHFEAIGCLRGLRTFQNHIDAAKEEVEAELKTLEE